MNYRLGGLGFMSGELFESEGGIPNLGLRDQGLALRWVQDHIHLFGGDKNQVTVSGGMPRMHLSFLRVGRRFADCYLTGSAGAGSIVHHLTSNGGRGELPFKRAYVESPGIIPATRETQNAGAVDFLAALGVPSFAEARKMDSTQIIRANADVIYGAKTSNFKYSPQAAGDYINNTAFTALRDGLVHGGVDLLVSHTANEGVVFMPTYATTDAAFTQYLAETFPNATESEIQHLVNDLYPLSAYDGQWHKRNTAFVGDYGLNCYTNALAHAYRGRTHNYEWDVFPALHGYDFLHVFFDGVDQTGMVNATYAGILQEYISSFVMAGNPNADGLPIWPVEGDNFAVMAMTSHGPNMERDSTEGERCAWLRRNELLS
jgi:carboxylesterase type B